MTPAELNRAVAERKGWTNFRTNQFGYQLKGSPPDATTYHRQSVPDYDRSLDASRKLLADLSEEEWEKFVDALLTILGASVADGDYERKILTAAPAQICTAYLAATEARK